MAMAIALVFPSAVVRGDLKSPRMVHSAWMMVFQSVMPFDGITFPPRMIYWDPRIEAFLETLFPVSYED